MEMETHAITLDKSLGPRAPRKLATQENQGEQPPHLEFHFQLRNGLMPQEVGNEKPNF